MTEIPTPLPPQFLAAVGHPGEARLVSLCWTSCGDACVYDDGRRCGTDDAWSYLAFVRHPAVAPHPAGWDLGSSDEEGRHRLLLNLGTGTAAVGTAAEVRAAVRGQWPVGEEPALTAGQVEEVMRQLERATAARPMPTAEQLLESMREHGRLVAEMVKWLDQWEEEQR